ncbi:hypothetical protein M430DRAFT_18076 [Amorphotheca resinae ATCC 22711]|uniref:Uncharacterized protein n=1 Tax=Amorphotheca resinae ATCC 22711 TaxID=857342 RepID=A0A2T3B716_AMORE|nr:hypothetical protein M430DRAFT_18076 [Amorphotheca resinae ATCC 22711]PSS22528.1 hypothetical protein M430DRAFT_18076 [Amorphotheca resinae ATCC 22711]
MESSELSARLRFLNDSAHLLATTTPATSKYLMSRYHSLMFERELEQSDAQRRRACGACGTIMILGWEATLQMESRRPRRKNSSQKRDVQTPSKAIVYKCESCSRITRFNTPPPAPRRKIGSSRTKSSLGTGVPTPSQAKEANPNTGVAPSTNSSSRKRAKTRKQSGLEAILARKKASEASTSGFGLDLMDFMKKA